jgi:hypothetical protein
MHISEALKLKPGQKVLREKGRKEEHDDYIKDMEYMMSYDDDH